VSNGNKAVHLRGFGLIGSLLAHTLSDAGIDFSWFDIDLQTPNKACAWKASTGCVYPSGEDLDKRNYAKIRTLRAVSERLETANYAFTQKSIPHHSADRELQVAKTIGGLKILNRPSYHLNVQAFVEHTRELFKDRISEDPRGALVVNSNGFHSLKPTSYRWGWHCEATVAIEHPDLYNMVGRTCFNLKEGRFNNTYLYPKPGTDKYYFGTHFIFQNKIKPLETSSKIAWCLKHAQEQLEGIAEVYVDTSTCVEGWRPAFLEDSNNVLMHNNELFIKPQMANGLRHHPEVMSEILVVIRTVHGSQIVNRLK
jgi:hypothetical protein